MLHVRNSSELDNIFAMEPEGWWEKLDSSSMTVV
jgi:hypothetical protein